MDFGMIRGSTPEEIEENKFKLQVNMFAKIERLRHFVGLENCNLLRIVAQAAEILKTNMGPTRKSLSTLYTRG